MKEFLLKHINGQLVIIDNNGHNHILTHILTLFPERTVFALYGPMGVGKTTFIRNLMIELGTNDVVNSPTFAIVNVYSSKEGEVYHFDCYRLNIIQEAIDLGIEDYLYSGNYCFIEWPEKIEELLPSNYVKMNFNVIDANTRMLLIE